MISERDTRSATTAARRLGQVGLVDRRPPLVDREEIAVDARGAEFGERKVVGAEHRGKPGHDPMLEHPIAGRRAGR